MAEPSGYGMETLDYEVLMGRFNDLFNQFNRQRFEGVIKGYIDVLGNRSYKLNLLFNRATRSITLGDNDKETLISSLVPGYDGQLYVASNIRVNPKITSMETLKRNYFSFVEPGESFEIDLYDFNDQNNISVQWRLHPNFEPIRNPDPDASFLTLIKQLPKGKWMEFQSKFHVKLGSHHISYFDLAQLSQSQIVFQYGNYLRYVKSRESPVITLLIPFEAISIKKESTSTIIRSSSFNLYGHLLNTSSLTHFVWDTGARRQIRDSITIDNSQLQLVSVLWYSVFQPIFANTNFLIDGASPAKELPFLFNLIEHGEKFSLKNFEIFDKSLLGHYITFHSILINIPILAYQLLDFLEKFALILPRDIVPVVRLFYRIVDVSLKFSVHAIRSRSRQAAIYIFRVLSDLVRVNKENEYQIEFGGFSGYEVESGVDILSTLTLPQTFLFYLARIRSNDKITTWCDGFLFNYRANYPDLRDDYFQFYLQDVYFKDDNISSGAFLKQTVFNLISGIVLYAYTCCLETVQSINFNLRENQISIAMSELIPPTFGEIKDIASLIAYSKQVLVYFGTDVLLNKLTLITGKALKPLEVATSILITSYIRFLVLNIMQTSGDLPSKDTIYTFMTTIDPAAHFNLIATVTATITSILTLIPTAIINSEKVTAYFSSQLPTGTLPLGSFQFYYFVLSQCTTLPKNSNYLSRINSVYERYYLPSSSLFARATNPDLKFMKFYQKITHRYNDLLFFLFALAFEKLNLLKVEQLDSAITNLDKANGDLLSRYDIPYTPFAFEKNQDDTSKAEAEGIAIF